jgi:hypothetical protein
VGEDRWNVRHMEAGSSGLTGPGASRAGLGPVQEGRGYRPQRCRFFGLDEETTSGDSGPGGGGGGSGASGTGRGPTTVPATARGAARVAGRGAGGPSSDPSDRMSFTIWADAR